MKKVGINGNSKSLSHCPVYKKPNQHQHSIQTTKPFYPNTKNQLPTQNKRYRSSNQSKPLMNKSIDSFKTITKNKSRAKSRSRSKTNRVLGNFPNNPKMKRNVSSRSLRGFELLEKANFAENEFFALMKKYKKVKSQLLEKYNKAKHHFEVSQQKVKKYRTKLETKQKEVKYLKSEIKVLKKKEFLVLKDKNKLESTELRGMRAFHEAQLEHLKGSLVNLEVDYHKKLDKVTVQKQLKLKEIEKVYSTRFESQKLEIEAMHFEIDNFKAKELQWDVERNDLEEIIKKLEQGKDEKRRSVSRKKKKSKGCAKKNRLHLDEEVIDPLKLLRSSCEVLEELGIGLSSSVAKISRISRLSNKIARKSQKNSSASPSQGGGGLRRKKKNRQVDSQSLRNLPSEYLSFGKRNQSLAKSAKSKRSKPRKKSKKRKTKQPKSTTKNKPHHPFHNIKFEQFRTEPHYSKTPPKTLQNLTTEINPDEDISRYLKELGLSQDQEQLFGNFSGAKKNSSKIKLSSLTQDIHHLLNNEKATESEAVLNMNPHYSHSPSRENSKERVEKTGFMVRDTFSGDKRGARVEESGSKNRSYLDYYNKQHSNDTDRLMNAQNRIENGRIVVEEEDSEFDDTYSETPRGHKRSSSRTKLNSLISRVLDEHNSIRKVNQGFEKKLGKIEDMISRLSEQHGQHPSVTYEQNSNIKIMDQQRDRSSIGELRNSAKKVIGFAGPDKELSVLEARVNMSRDILNTGEKQIIAAYTDKKPPRSERKESAVLELNPPVLGTDKSNSQANRPSLAQKNSIGLTNPTFESHRVTLEGVFNNGTPQHDHIHQHSSAVTENMFVTPEDAHRGSSPQILQNLQNQNQYSSYEQEDGENGRSYINIQENTQTLEFMDTNTNRFNEETGQIYEEDGEESSTDQMYFTKKYQEIIEQINGMKKEMEFINDENESLLRVMDENGDIQK